MDGILPGVRLAARSRIYHSAPHELARLEYPWPEVLRPASWAGNLQRLEVRAQEDVACDEPERALPRSATPWYANMVVRLGCAPQVTPEALFEALMRLEAQLGRNRLMEPRWGARFVDIDLLAFGRERRSTERLILPHPRIAQRAFVLLPLAEIAPDEVSPELFEGLSFLACDTMIF